MRLGPRGLVWALASWVLLFVACGEERRPEETDARSLQALLARAQAHVGIEEWEAARLLLDEASRLAPEEPAVIYDEAVVALLASDPVAARAAIEALGDPAGELAPRRAYLEGRLALEEGNLEAELAAYERAAELDPDNAPYRFAIAEAQLRSPDAHPSLRGRWLAEARERWPENVRVASEYVLWALGREEASARDRGVAILGSMVEDSGHEEAKALFDRGVEEARRNDRPVALRQALNLLRATQRYRSDAAELEDALQLRLVERPVSTPVPERQASVLPEFFEVVLLPEPPADLRAVKRWEDAAAAPAALREASLVVLSGSSLDFLSRTEKSLQRIAAVHGSAEVEAGDLDGDGRQEVLLVDEAGLRVFSRDGEDWTLLGEDLSVAGYRAPRVVDWEADGDLDLLTLDPRGRLGLHLHRGEAGLGVREEISLAFAGDVLDYATTDIDGDRDRDLVVLTSAGLEVWRNWGQGKYGRSWRSEAPLPRSQLHAAEVHGDGYGDVLLVGEEGLRVFEGDSRGRLAAGSVLATPFGASFALADLDLDGTIDGVSIGESGLPRGWRNPGDGRFEGDSGAGAESSLGLLALDLDGDRDDDLVSWDAEGWTTYRNDLEGSPSWLGIALRSPARKVPRDGWGTQVEVATGSGHSFYEPDRPDLIAGLGSEDASFVRATWPNGISEYLFAPASRQLHEIELTLRIEGSCPFLYAPDGEGMRFVTDLLGLAPLGMLVAEGTYVEADPEEYLRLPDWVRPVGSELELWITEELREVTYLDQVELVAVDAPGEVAAYNGEQFGADPVAGLALRPLADLRAPLRVVADDGREVLDVVRELDHRYLTNHRGARLYQGAVPPHRLEIELPPEIAAAEHPALLMIGWLHWGNTSTHLARSQDPEGAPVLPYLEVPDGQGRWRRAGRSAGLPAGKTKPVVVDLGGILNPQDPRLRLTTDFEVYWDQIAVGRLLDREEIGAEVRRLAPNAAELEFGGFARWYRPAPNGPYLFDASDLRDLPWRQRAGGREVLVAWTELEGYLTELGAVEDLLQEVDERMVVFGSGERIRLAFDLAKLPPPAAGYRRTYFLHSEGWERDGDPNVSCRGTVDPLPRRGLVGDPCNGFSDDDEDRGETRRTRWVDGDRLRQRAEARALEIPGGSGSSSRKGKGR